MWVTSRSLWLLSIWSFPEDQLPSGFPTIDMGPQLKVVERSRTATMLCAASGNPDPEITWFKDFLPVNTSNNNGRIKQLRSGNQCFYPCSRSPFPSIPGFYYHLKVFLPSHFAFIPLSISPHPNPFLIFCSYKASVILALVHPFSYCRSALLLPWFLAVFLGCPSLSLSLCCCCGMSWLCSRLF